jgi:hypothetical protein
MRICIPFNSSRENMIKKEILSRRCIPSHLLTRRTFLEVTAAGSIGAIAGLTRIEGATNDGLIAVGLRKQLLVDDYVLAQKENVTRELGRATKANGGEPIKFWTKDKEGGRVPIKAWIYASPFYDEEQKLFRMWSRVFPDGKSMRYGYSESVDGINFDFKTELKGLYSNGDYNSVVYIDSHETDPSHRYKIGYDGARPGVPNGACLAHSADGLHWTPYLDGKPVTGRAADFTNCLIWDADARTYRLFTRTDYGTAGGTGEIRGMRSMTNPDVTANPAGWSLVRNWLFDSEGKEEYRRRQIYSMTDWMYCGVHFGLFSVYEWPGDFSEGKKTDHGTRHERDIMNYYLATGRDGDHFDLTWIYASQPLVERGGKGAWDKDMILPTNWIVTHADQHWIYYGGANERHGTESVFAPQRESAVGLARLPLDRFICFTAGDTPGLIVTKPFLLEGSLLELNLDAKSGELQLEVLDANGKPLPAFSGKSSASYTSVDKLRFQPKWNGQDLKSLRGSLVRLRFRLRRAKLYAFEVKSTV